MAQKILVIDDDKNFTEVVRVALTDKHYEVCTADDGNEGLKQVRAFQPDLIILDVIMPRMNGYEFMHALNARRVIDRQPEIPVIMLTAKEELREVFKYQGIKEYLMKPLEYQDMVQKIENYLGAND